MAEAAREQLQAALRSLQQQISAMAHGNSASSSSGCSEQIEQLTSHVEALLHTHAKAQQALENKSIAERALRNVVASKEAEAARLRGEVERLRRSQTATTTAAAAERVTATQASQDQHSTLADDDADAAAAVGSPAARQAVLEEAVPAKDKPTALVHQLQSEVSACQSRIAALESELAAATTEHSARLAQQQKAFLAKLEQLRQVHVQQVAAASQEAQKHVEQHAARSQQLEEQLLQSKQQQLKQQDTIVALREELRRQQQQQQQQQQSGAKKQLPPCPAPAAPDASAAADTTPAAVNQALGNNSSSSSSSSKDQPPSAGAAGSPTAAPSSAPQSKAEARAAAAAEVAALKDMEAQLLRLSTTVKSYQAEREQLRQAFMTGCAERQALQQQVLELTRKLQGSSASSKQAATQQDASAATAPGSPATKLPEASEAIRAYWGSLSG